MIPDPEKAARRGVEARALSEHPLLKEAWTRIEEDLRLARERVPIGDTGMHTRLVLAEQMYRRVRAHIEQLIVEGDAAQLILRDRESLRERMSRAVLGNRNTF